jgi:hypothetical protein
MTLLLLIIAGSFGVGVLAGLGLSFLAFALGRGRRQRVDQQDWPSEAGLY